MIKTVQQETTDLGQGYTIRTEVVLESRSTTSRFHVEYPDGKTDYHELVLLYGGDLDPAEYVRTYKKSILNRLATHGSIGGWFISDYGAWERKMAEGEDDW